MSEGPRLSAHQILKRYLNPRPRNYYFRFLKTNGPPSRNSASGFDFDPFTAIGMWFSIGLPNFIKIGLSAAELKRHNDFQDASIASQIYFRFLLWSRLKFRKVQSYRHIKFRQDISIRGRYITTSGFWKQTAAILKLYFRFRFWPFHCHRMRFYSGLPNFMQIGWSPTELWRHIDFTRWRP